MDGDSTGGNWRDVKGVGVIWTEVRISDRIEAQVHKGMTRGRDLVTQLKFRTSARGLKPTSTKYKAWMTSGR